jgi:outer membrane receptor protein involved in Fe transport
MHTKYFSARTWRPLLGSASLTAAALATGAPADTASSQSVTIEEVVVTALRRETLLQDTPISIATLSGDALQKHGDDDLADFASSVPGLTLRDNGPGQRRPIVRGIQGAGEAQVATLYGEYPVTSTPGATNDAGRFAPDIKLYDIERIEVLRGPQGTLYGGGSVGGTIRIIPRQAQLSEFSGSVSATAGRVSQGEANYGASGMVNLPLVQDTLGVRLVGYSREDAGFIDNVALGRNDFNEGRTHGGRASVRFEPTENFTMTSLLIYQDSDTDAGFASVTSLGELRSDVPALDPFADRVQLYGLTTQLDMQWASLIANVSYYKRDLDFTFTFPNLAIPFTAPVVRGTGIVQQPQIARSRTYEVRLASPASSALGWTVGAFRQGRDATLRSRIPFADANGTPDPASPLFQDRFVDAQLDQDAVFGEASYRWFDRLTLTAGVRWFSFDVANASRFLVNTGGTPGTGVAARSQFDDSDHIVKLNASFDLGSDAMVYAQYSEGFRAGGANQPIQTAIIPSGFASDEVQSYEVGLKSQWLDRRLTVNLAGYHLVWNDIQVEASTPDGLFRFTDNAGEAQVDGAELEVAAQLTERFDLTLSYGYTDARLTEDQPFVPGVARRGLSDNSIPAVPEHAANLGGEYRIPLGASKTLQLRGDVQYVSDSTNLFNPFLVSATTGAPTTTPDPFFARHEAYTVANVRVELVDERWRLGIFADNVFDERGETFIFIDNFRPAPGYTYYVQPRTVGVMFSRDF